MLYTLKLFFLFFITFWSSILGASALETYDKIVENVNKNVAEEKEKYIEIIEGIQERIKKNDGSIRQTVGLTESAPSFTLQPKATDSFIDQAISNYKRINEQKSNIKINDGMYIFISFSMPKSLLESFDKAARHIGARLVIRGLKDNSFKETLNYIKEIKKEGIIIDINPALFEEFKVNLVPTFIVSNNNKYDKLVGNVSITYVIEQFISHGETKVISQTYLKRWSNVN